MIQSTTEATFLTWGAGVLSIGLLIALLIVYKNIEWDVRIHGWKRLFERVRGFLKAAKETVAFILFTTAIFFVVVLVVVVLPIWLGTVVLGLFNINL